MLALVRVAIARSGLCKPIPSLCIRRWDGAQLNYVSPEPVALALSLYEKVEIYPVFCINLCVDECHVRLYMVIQTKISVAASFVCLSGPPAS